MLSFFKRRRLKRERNIYKFFDGHRTRTADPMAVMLALETHAEFNSDKHLPMALVGDVDSIRLAAKATCDAFNVKQWREGFGGLTVSELLALLCDFTRYCEELKKNIDPSATASVPLVERVECLRDCLAENSSPTSNASESSSTSTGSSNESQPEC